MRPVMAIVILSAVILLAACGKDKFQTKPTIEIDSFGPDEVFEGGFLRVRLKYFDKEGDLSKGTLTYIRVRTNTFTAVPNDQPDTTITELPEFPKKTQGEIALDIEYGYLNENDDDLSLGKNDSMYFKFVVMDTEDHVSDTITSKGIVAVQQ